MHPRWLCAKRKFTKNAPGGGFVVTFWEKQRRRMRNIICLSSMKLSSIQASRDCTWQWNMWCKLSFEIYANFGKRKRKSPWRQRERLLMFVNISFIVSMRLIKSAPWRVSNTPKGYRTGDSVVDKTKLQRYERLQILVRLMNNTPKSPSDPGIEDIPVRLK